MMHTQLAQKIEIRFWDQAIPLMSSSRPVQKLIRETWRLTHDHKDIPWIPAALIFSAGFGWCLGYLIGLAGTALR